MTAVSLSGQESARSNAASFQPCGTLKATFGVKPVRPLPVFAAPGVGVGK